MHTTIIEGFGIESCNFCGAARTLSNEAPIQHHEGCCIPQGEEAIAKEQKIIDHICSGHDEDE